MTKEFMNDLYNAEYRKTFTKQGGLDRYKMLCRMFYENDRTNEMCLILTNCENVLMNKYNVTLEEIEAAEMDVLKAM